jgi:ribonuclease-3
MPGDKPAHARQPADLAARLGITFRDPALLVRALVHGSWVHEHPDAGPGENERLEFLGDAVVSLVVSDALYARHREDDEGVLSARRAAVVSTAGLARLARRLELGEYLLLGEGEAQRGGRARAAILASAFEAVAGAIFVDRGWEVVRDWLLDHAGPELAADLPLGTLKSPKSRLQELTQRRDGARPEYRVLETSGPDHSRHFRVAVVIAGEVLAEGEGASRRAAETGAAEAALTVLTARGEDAHAVRP